MAKKKAPAPEALSKDDRELLRICAPFRKQILGADRYAREMGIRSRLDPIQWWPSADREYRIRPFDLGKLPAFQIYDFGPEVVSVASRLGRHAFYWPPFWDELRRCSSGARNPSARDASVDYRRQQVKEVSGIWKSRAHVKKPKRKVDWPKLHADRAKLRGIARRKWEIDTAKELGIERDSLRRELRKRRPEKN